MINVSIVIPNYNGEKILKNNLPKVVEVAKDYQERTRKNVEIIVVDDGSTDASVSIISNISSKGRSAFGRKNQISNSIDFKFLENSKNLGFSSTVNRGVKEASGEIIVLLNTDILPEKNFLMPLLEHFKNENVFAVGCMDKSIEEENAILRGRGIGKWQRGFLVHCRGEVDKTNTLWVSGGSGVFRKTIWDKLGGFNELYNPFYWEDLDLSYRALKSGYKILFEPESVVVHEHEKGAIKSKYSPFHVKIIAYRNQFIFVWGNMTDPALMIAHVLWLPYHLLKALIRRDRAFFIGFFKALILLPKIIQFKLKAQKLFIKKDREIIKEFVK